MKNELTNAELKEQTDNYAEIITELSQELDAQDNHVRKLYVMLAIMSCTALIFGLLIIYK